MKVNGKGGEGRVREVVPGRQEEEGGQEWSVENVQSIAKVQSSNSLLSNNFTSIAHSPLAACVQSFSLPLLLSLSLSVNPQSGCRVLFGRTFPLQNQGGESARQSTAERREGAAQLTAPWISTVGWGRGRERIPGACVPPRSLLPADIRKPGSCPTYSLSLSLSLVFFSQPSPFFLPDCQTRCQRAAIAGCSRRNFPYYCLHPTSTSHEYLMPYRRPSLLLGVLGFKQIWLVLCPTEPERLQGGAHFAFVFEWSN